MTVKWRAKAAKANRLPVFQSAIRGLANAMASALSSLSSMDYCLSAGNFLLIKSFDSGPYGKSNIRLVEKKSLDLDVYGRLSPKGG